MALPIEKSLFLKIVLSEGMNFYGYPKYEKFMTQEG